MPESDPIERWRTGSKVALNVYRGDTPMFQCHTPEQAAEVVELLNRGTAANEIGNTPIASVDDPIKQRIAEYAKRFLATTGQVQMANLVGGGADAIRHLIVALREARESNADLLARLNGTIAALHKAEQERDEPRQNRDEIAQKWLNVEAERNELLKVKRERDEARRDSARIDWREKHPNHGFGLYADGAKLPDGTRELGSWADGNGGSHPTYRAAIDAAISAHKAESGEPID